MLSDRLVRTVEAARSVDLCLHRISASLVPLLAGLLLLWLLLGHPLDTLIRVSSRWLLPGLRLLRGPLGSVVSNFAGDNLTFFTSLLLRVKLRISIVLATENIELLVASWLVVNLDRGLCVVVPGPVAFPSALVLVFKSSFRLILLLLSLGGIVVLRCHMIRIVGYLSPTALNGYRIITPSQTERTIAS